MLANDVRPRRRRTRTQPSRPVAPLVRRFVLDPRFFAGAAVGAILATSVVALIAPSEEPASATLVPPPVAAVVAVAPASVEPAVEIEAPTPAFEIPEDFEPMGPPLSARGPAVVLGRIAKNERVADVLARAGASTLEIDRALATLAGKVDFRKTRVGDNYEIEMGDEGHISRFVYATSPLDEWVVEFIDGAYASRKIEIKVERQVALVEGEVRSSLYDAFIEADESPALAMDLAHVFRFDVDFNTETRKGDRFRIYVEKDMHDGQRVGYGKIVAAEYGEHRLFAFEGEYYDEQGKSSRRAFLKSPLTFTRVSSAFGYRTHPITKHRHFHGGVDYAAPAGTQVQSVADGVVTFAANKGANGNMVKVRHASGYESFYLHLSKILVKPGQRVSQSTLVGRVGSTGRSTGPHLDFRLKRNGKYLDPTQRVIARNKTVPSNKRAAFSRVVAKWGGRLGDNGELAMAQ